MGFSVMLWGAEKLVPAEYWCPYGTYLDLNFVTMTNFLFSHSIILSLKEGYSYMQ